MKDINVNDWVTLVYCDTCGECLELATANDRAIADQAQYEGWIIQRDKDFCCSACYRNYKAD